MKNDYYLECGDMQLYKAMLSKVKLHFCYGLLCMHMETFIFHPATQNSFGQINDTLFSFWQQNVP